MTPHDLIAAFDVLADAPDGVKRLRELVLSLAVRGKLVPQDAREEPIARTLGNRVVAVADPPFPLPEGWAWSSIEQLGDVLGGGTPSKSNPRFWSGSIPWVSPKDMKVARLADSQDHVSPEAVEGSSIKLVPSGSLLMVVRGMILAHSFPVAVTEVEVTVNQDMKALVPFSPDLADYLLLLLQGSRLRVLGLVERSTHGTCKLPYQALATMPLALPPLSEQRRIVARVDELMGLLDRLDAARATRDAVRRAARDAALADLRDAPDSEAVEAAWSRIARQMDDLFAEPEDVAPLRQAVLALGVNGRMTNTEEGNGADQWEAIRFGDAFETIFTGPFGTSLKAADYVVDGTPVINPQNLKGGIIQPTADTCVGPDTLARLSSFVVQEGDVVVARRGEMGRCAVVEARCSGWLCGTGSLVLRPQDDLCARYVTLYLRSPGTVAQLIGESVGSTMHNLNQRIMTGLLFRRPPLAEQHRIVAKVDALMALCDDLEARLSATRDLQVQFASAAVHHLDV